MIPRRAANLPFHHRPPTTGYRFGTSLLMGMVLSAATLLPSRDHAADVTDRIVAVVNKEVIMLSELKTEMEPERKRLQQQHRGAELRSRLHQAEYRTLTRMIERRLQMQHAQTKGVDASEEDLRRTAMDLQQQGTPVNLDDPKEKNALKEQLILLTLENREVRTGVMVSETDIKHFYERHLTLFMLPEEYRISQILLLARKTESRKDLRARAREVYDQVKRGREFDDLALRYSDAPDATRGGALGFVRQGEMDPPIERAVAALQPGQISEPVETADGIQIIRLDEKKTAQFRPLEEVKNEMQGLVFQQKSADRYQRWMTDLKSKAYIEVKL
ncbi:MAG TPA: peptidylprolyl isomerase [Nitrospiraceae bacterium]|nr:peptidylprolyl isomerase [Nitrospiraceae bacterium]